MQFPRLEAKMTIGEIEDSSARCRYVKHSISSMWTSSTKSTPGTSSAMPWSMYLFTTLFISPRSLSENKKKLVVLLVNYRSQGKAWSKENSPWTFPWFGLLLPQRKYPTLKFCDISCCVGEISVQQSISNWNTHTWKIDCWRFVEFGRGQRSQSKPHFKYKTYWSFQAWLKRTSLKEWNLATLFQQRSCV